MAREVETLATACPLCLGVDEPSAMLPVELEIAYPAEKAIRLICRKCAFAINRALVEAGEAAPIQGVDDERGANRLDSGESLMLGAAADRGAVVDEGRSDSETPGFDRREPEAAPGGADLPGED